MYKQNFFSMIVAGATLVFSMGVSAQALYVTPSGDIGVGTNTPISSLEVIRSDGTAQILVTESDLTPGPRTLFRLSNNGNTKFGVLNSEAGVEWAFANPGTGFRLSRQGSGVVEMEILNNGDMNIAGVLTESSDVNAKQDIEAVNGLNILEKLTSLEISEWSYKDAPNDRHVGPMAQDFYAAFGLGNTDKGIATLDSSGVALAAIKALIDENASLQTQNMAHSEKIDTLERRLIALERQQVEMQTVVARVLENQQSRAVLTSTVMN